ncbi:B80 [Murid betaherpesvirus 8]|uniref:Capsid scaffolding protein n=3 Tax=Rat cytomegalovirus (isolate England) TaxID=1261657 RepID=K7XY03_RCMVE|nr:E80 [Murid betaherpesvirus 8]AKE44247.1 a80 [Rat cytomegalovirus ALL-03]AFX83395.1 E80 [Murid betaherpesvirus 8]AKB93275.1 B80 [Murid betaherpesvirus 8]WEG71867.1 capsid maturation protease [Murid betaherpesvirus 8]WPH24990.1 B80 [Murid betaherpesvirus 8]
MVTEGVGTVPELASLSGTGEKPVYVGGFVTLYAETPTDTRLRLPRDVVARELQRSGDASLPLNINHDDSSVVGSVRLFDTEAGLFCIGQLHSSTFLNIVGKAAEKSKLVARGPADGLDADPVVEYLSAGFPALSLSSCVPSEDCSERPNFFRHVSLCGLGRRRGTLAVYGRDCNWIVDKFSVLTEDERGAISGGALAMCADEGSDPFNSDPYGLLASSVDDGYIAERLCRLRYDKRLLGLSSSDTYVKASELPDDSEGHEAHSIICTDCQGEEDREIMAQAPHSLTPVVGAGTSSGQNVPIPSDCVYLSRDALMSILSAASNSSTVSPHNTYPTAPANAHSGMGHFERVYGQRGPYISGRPYGYPDADRYGYYDHWYRPRYDMEDLRWDRERFDVGSFRDRRRRRAPSPDDDDDDEDCVSARGRSRPAHEPIRKKRRNHRMEELSLPGESGYPKQVNIPEQRSPEDSNMIEFRATLNEIKKDISQIKSKTDKAGGPGPSREESVGSSDQRSIPVSDNGERKQELVNASCDPAASANVADGKRNGMLEVNKRMFMSLLNKID